MGEPDDKATRLAAALRANLRKRKDQARVTTPVEQPGEHVSAGSPKPPR